MNTPSRTPAFSLMPSPSWAQKVHRWLLADAVLLGRGLPGHLCSVAAAWPTPYSAVSMILLCFTVAAHSSNLDLRDFFSFFPRCCDCDRVTGVRTCWGGAFLLGVTALTWACLQYSGPMDLKEKHAVGHVRFPCGDCLCVSWTLPSCIYLPGRYLFGGF